MRGHRASNVVGGHRLAVGRGTQTVEQRDEIVVRRIPPGHEESLQTAVAALEQQDAVRGLAVPAGSARFLVIDVERCREIIVNDRADIRLVDAHAKGIRGDDDWHRPGHEGVLCRGSILRALAAVIGRGGNALRSEQGL